MRGLAVIALILVYRGTHSKFTFFKISIETNIPASPAAGDKLIFNSIDIENDPKTIRSQRVLYILNGDTLQYEMNMATHQATEFQNHLAASLKKVK